MRPVRRRLLAAALITIFSAAVVLFAAGAILSAILTKKVTARLEAVNAKIGSLRINLFTRGISIREFEWSPSQKTGTTDSTRAGPHRVVLYNIKASGVQVIALLRDKRVSIRKLEVEKGSVFINRDFQTDSIKIDSIPISSLDIDRLSIANIDLRIAKDTTIEYTGTVDVVLHFVALDSMMAWKDPSAYTMKNVESSVRNLKVVNWNDLYAFKIKEASFDKELMKVNIDSLELLPRPSTADWGKKVKSQDTRTRIVIANVSAEGVNMAKHLEDTTIMVSLLDIRGAVVHAYKDKRYPFKRTKKFPLPMEAFRDMKIGIEVDSIRIHDGTITYEEFPVEGFRTASITFDELQATMSAVNNRVFNNLSGYSTLKASAGVMKHGKVEAIFQLPLDEKKRYSAKGSIKNLPLKELNPLLKDVAFIEVASGQLNVLTFDFTYDDVGSQGQVGFDYQDLRILSLKKEKEGDVNNFKTLLVNTAMKNDETLTGEISVQRNQQKAVFNLWTMSIVDGIRAAFMPGRKNKSSKATKAN
jgi:hypothetical protein